MTASSKTHRPRLLATIAVALISVRSATCFTTPNKNSRLTSDNRLPNNAPPPPPAASSTKTRPLFSSSSAPSSSSTAPAAATTTAASSDEYGERIFDATLTLQNYDQSQRDFMKADGEIGMGGGTSALNHVRSLSATSRSSLRDAVRTLIARAHVERDVDSSKGRIMLGFCSANVPEALSGLKTYVSELALPRGNLHGMDVDGVPIPPEELGSVYVKYSTGGAMKFSEMRRSGRGFDALWRPGDALLETYDGDFRGVYLNVELGDGVFRQFGVLPTDLFMEEDEDEDW